MNPLRAVLGLGVRERPAVCAKCGKSFTQYELPKHFMLQARNGETEDAGYYAIDRQVPGGWVPVYCPVDEHHELSSGKSLTVPGRYSPGLALAYERDERAALEEASA